LLSPCSFAAMALLTRVTLATVPSCNFFANQPLWEQSLWRGVGHPLGMVGKEITTGDRRQCHPRQQRHGGETAG
ncbi:MAG: hypothetical protein AAF514_12500, partial [Verrucomicrobiota bacterium]